MLDLYQAGGIRGRYAHDAAKGREPLKGLAGLEHPYEWIRMDKAYKGDETRELDLGFELIVPPKRDRLNPWVYDEEMYKCGNKVERLFRRLKGFCRKFSRFEKLDVVFLGFVAFAMLVECLK